MPWEFGIFLLINLIVIITACVRKFKYKISFRKQGFWIWMIINFGIAIVWVTFEYFYNQLILW